MSSTVLHVTVDCADPYRLAQFWSEVTGRPLGEDDFPGDPESLVQLPTGATLLFVQVAEPKTSKNRMHLCLQPDGPREQEVQRLLDAGATLVDDRRAADGTGWAVLADPEGNEFCVLRSAEERARTSRTDG